jgi:hypothetical protein
MMSADFNFSHQGVEQNLDVIELMNADVVKLFRRYFIIEMNHPVSGASHS